MTSSVAATQAVLDVATQTSQEGMKDSRTITGLAGSRLVRFLVHARVTER